MLKAQDWIVQTIRDDYVFPNAEEVPETVLLTNNRSGYEDPKFVWAELLRLERLGCIARVSERPRVVLPLSKVFSKKCRLVVDASRGLKSEPISSEERRDLRGVGHFCRDSETGGLCCHRLPGFRLLAGPPAPQHVPVLRGALSGPLVWRSGFLDMEGPVPGDQGRSLHLHAPASASRSTHAQGGVEGESVHRRPQHPSSYLR